LGANRGASQASVPSHGLLEKLKLKKRRYMRRGLYKENNKLLDCKNIFTPHIPPDFIVLTSLTHTRKILFIVLQIGKAKDLSASLHRAGGTYSYHCLKGII
jgi:hypothetical protein